MPTFCVDESGFTGEDLLSADQPVFAHATVDLDSAEARKIVSSIFAGVNAKKLKYARLRRRPRYQDGIVELVTIMANDRTRAATWIAHKEFALVTLIVDWWIEPLAHKSGLNLYEADRKLKLSDFSHLCFCPVATLTEAQDGLD